MIRWILGPECVVRSFLNLTEKPRARRSSLDLKGLRHVVTNWRAPCKLITLDRPFARRSTSGNIADHSGQRVLEFHQKLIPIARFLLACMLTCVFGSHALHAQKLTEQLAAENSADLADAAREKGDIIRGAILYHQGNVNCAKCHRPAAGSSLIGPDLKKLAPDTTDAFIVESILLPSKKINEGFETYIVATTDGRVLQGTVVERDPTKIILRDGENVDRLITLKQAKIDEIEPSDKSIMPEGLVDQLKSRQQFLDLVRYVLEVEVRGLASDVMAQAAPRRQLAPELNGLALINNLNCVGCHRSELPNASLKPKMGPDLAWSGKRLNPHYIAEFIADPQSAKPGTSMPHLLGGLDAQERRRVAKSITHFLTATREGSFETTVPDKQAVLRGAELFDSVGCVACHAPRENDATEEPLGDSIPLGDVARKYDRNALAEFLEDPLAVRPGGRMPNMQLSHFEAVDLAHFLTQATVLTQSTPEPWDEWLVIEDQVQAGRELFYEYRCIACHVDPSGSDKRPLPKAQPLHELNLNQGCLEAEPRGNAPNFHLNDDEVQAIQSALGKNPLQLTEQQQIDVTLKMFNCVACHDRDHLGGITAERNSHFQTTNLNLGDQGRIPPTLTNVGTKLQPEWMRDVLVNGRSVRPYMKTRMPQFGESNVGHLVPLFQEVDEQLQIEPVTFDDQKEMREFGLRIAGNKGLNCVACHTYKFNSSDTMPAVDLTEMSQRLKKAWFHQYMQSPGRFTGNTVMPSFWPGGNAIRPDIEGEPAYQIEALWQYLIDGRQARMPSGVVRESLEIVVGDETKILRRTYPSIGKRGIGVGYPGGVNLAFDAEQLRLGMIWQGKFVDPGGVWTGQGSGNVRPLGKPIQFAPGPDLDDANDPWLVDDGRPPNHRFLGYTLDEQRRPKFRYAFDNIDVTDFFTPVSDEATDKPLLRRSVTVSSAKERDKLRFRVASGTEIVQEDSGAFAVGNGMHVRVASGQTCEVVELPEGNQQLLIMLDVPANREVQLVIEYFWK